MIGKQNKDVNFFDSYVFDNLLPEKHMLLDIKKEIDFLLRCYPESQCM
jgi:hypothetical protein